MDKNTVRQPSLRNVTIRGADKDFDTLNIEETIREFCAFIRSIISRYNENLILQEDAEAKEQDIRHFIEMANNLSDDEKKIIYAKLSNTLQDRRQCKNENEIIRPLYDFVADKNLLNRLSQIQGAVGSVKKTISNRTYACRTDVLDDIDAKIPK